MWVFLKNVNISPRMLHLGHGSFSTWVPLNGVSQKWMSEKENNAMVRKLALLFYRICSVCKEMVFKFANEIKDLLCNCF